MRRYIAQQGEVDWMDRWEPTYFLNEPLDDYRKIIILRDPVERWISNCPAPGVIIDVAKDKKSIDDLFDDIKTWQYDEHAAPQINFIKGLDLSNAIWFFCDNNLSSSLQRFFMSEGFKSYSAPEVINQQSTDPLIKQSAQVWRKLLQIPENFKRFQEAYQEDYKLIRSVKFYGSI